MPTIGLLTQRTTGDPNVWVDYKTDFTNALCTNGYTTPIPEQTGVDYDSYFAGAKTLMQGDPKTNAPPANVIVTAGKVAAQGCYDATKGSQTAVVVASAGDLNLNGLTKGAKLTGCTNGQFDKTIVQARIARMQQLSPIGVAVVGNHGVGPVGDAMDYVQTLLGLANDQVIDLNPTNFQTANDLKGKLDQLKQQHPNVNVLYVCSDPFLRTNGNLLVDGAHNHPQGKISTMHEFGEWVDHHKGDRAYGPKFSQLFQRAAGYVDQILNGADPANLPVFVPQIVDCVSTPKEG